MAIGPDEELDDAGTGESGQAADLFDDRFDEDSLTASETIIFDHPTLTVDDPVYQQTVTDLLAELRSLRALNTEMVGGTEVASGLLDRCTRARHFRHSCGAYHRCQYRRRRHAAAIIRYRDLQGPALLVTHDF